MIIRIVKMEFHPEKLSDFMSVFNESCELIRNFPGCSRLELLQDRLHNNILFTYSWWESENHLNIYRHSELFKGTWARTKIHFSAKPEAWSVEQLYLND
jgi:quinol monooxygenase YgiN